MKVSNSSILSLINILIVSSFTKLIEKQVVCWSTWNKLCNANNYVYIKSDEVHIFMHLLFHHLGYFVWDILLVVTLMQ